MKIIKIIVSIIALGTLAPNGFSQGQLQFQNALTSLLFFNSTGNLANRVTSAPLVTQPASGSTSGGVVDVGLYWSTAVFTDPTQGNLADVVTMSPTAPGAIVGGLVTLPGTFAGEQVYVQVYAWDSKYSTPDAALAAGAVFGAWSAGQNNTTYGFIGAPELVNSLTVSPGPGVPIFGTGPGQFGRCVIPTPEPATMALGGLGAAVLLLFRRRKRASAN